MRRRAAAGGHGTSHRRTYSAAFQHPDGHTRSDNGPSAYCYITSAHPFAYCYIASTDPFANAFAFAHPAADTPSPDPGAGGWRRRR